MASPLGSPRQSQSPPPMTQNSHQQQGQQQSSNPSKRDKRRTMLANSLNDLASGFNLTKDEHYRTQLSVLNAEMRAIAETNCHPDDGGMLPDLGEEVEHVVEDLLRNSGIVLPPKPEKAGRFYSKFIDSVNNAVENRDVTMSELHYLHGRRSKTISLHHNLALHSSEAEYQHLLNNIRQRLLNRLQQNRKKLITDKDHLDANDTALSFLHPAQYTATQPERSPGGRQHFQDVFTTLDGPPTRKLRGRRGEADVGDTFSTAGGVLAVLASLENGGLLGNNGTGAQSPGGNTKRKRGRNGKVREPEDILLSSHFDISRPSTPRSGELTTKQKTAAADNYVKPLYSLDKLFSEKELTAAGTAAAASTVRYYMELHQQRLNEEDGLEVTNVGTGSNGNTGTDTPLNDEDTAMEDESLSSAPHGPTTRNVTSAAAAALSAPVYNMTPIIPTSFITKSLTAPPPPPLRAEEAALDLDEIRRIKSGNAPLSMMNGFGTSALSALAAAATPGLGRSLSGMGLGGVSMSRGENMSAASRRGVHHTDDDNISISGKRTALTGLGITSAALERKASGDGERKKVRRN